MTMPTDEEIAVAVLAVLNANSANAYDLDDSKKLPIPLPAAYCEVTVSRRFGGEPRRNTSPGTSGYRVVARAIGTTVSNAREITRRVSLIEDAVITIGDASSTPVQFESAEDVGDDEGMWSGTTAWTLTL